MYPSFRRQPESIFLPSLRRCTRHSGDLLVIPAKAGIHFLTVTPAMYPSFRRFTRHSGESRNPFSYRHSGDVPVIPAIYSSFRRKPESIFLPSLRRCTRHSGDLPVIPAPAGIHFRTVIPAMYPSFRRKPESSAAPYSTLPRSNGFAPQPPKKSAIFSDATHLQSVHKSCTLAPASPATRPQGSDVPPKANPRRPSTRRPQPTGRRLKSKGKGIGRKIGQPPKTGFRTTRPKPSVLQPSSDPARTPLYSTGVCQATPRAFPPLYAGPAMGRGMEN